MMHRKQKDEDYRSEGLKSRLLLCKFYMCCRDNTSCESMNKTRYIWARPDFFYFGKNLEVFYENINIQSPFSHTLIHEDPKSYKQDLQKEYISKNKIYLDRGFYVVVNKISSYFNMEEGYRATLFVVKNILTGELYFLFEDSLFDQKPILMFPKFKNKSRVVLENKYVLKWKNELEDNLEKVSLLDDFLKGIDNVKI